MTSPDTKEIRAQMEAMAGFTAGPWSANCPREERIVGRMHRVLNPEDYPAAFVPAWDRPQAGQVDGTDEAIANARLIAAAPDIYATILALCDALDEMRAEIERLQTIIGNLHTVEEKHRETANTHFHRANRLQVENERLRRLLRDGCDLMSVEVDALKSGVSIDCEMRPGQEDQHTMDAITELDGWIDRAGRAALAQKGDQP